MGLLDFYLAGSIRSKNFWLPAFGFLLSFCCDAPFKVLLILEQLRRSLPRAMSCWACRGSFSCTLGNFIQQLCWWCYAAKLDATPAKQRGRLIDQGDGLLSIFHSFLVSKRCRHFNSRQAYRFFYIYFVTEVFGKFSYILIQELLHLQYIVGFPQASPGLGVLGRINAMKL